MNSKSEGAQRVTKAHGGCVIFEDFVGFGLSGYSVNIYDRTTREWRQTWADSQGDLHEYRGRRTGDAMVFLGYLPPLQPNAPRRLTRMTIRRLSADAIQHTSEFSTDGGLTWQLSYDLRYRRK